MTVTSDSACNSPADSRVWWSSTKNPPDRIFTLRIWRSIGSSQFFFSWSIAFNSWMVLVGMTLTLRSAPFKVFSFSSWAMAVMAAQKPSTRERPRLRLRLPKFGIQPTRDAEHKDSSCENQLNWDQEKHLAPGCLIHQSLVPRPQRKCLLKGNCSLSSVRKKSCCLYFLNADRFFYDHGMACSRLKSWRTVTSFDPTLGRQSIDQLLSTSLGIFESSKILRLQNGSKTEARFRQGAPRRRIAPRRWWWRLRPSEAQSSIVMHQICVLFHTASSMVPLK